MRSDCDRRLHRHIEKVRRLEKSLDNLHKRYNKLLRSYQKVLVDQGLSVDQHIAYKEEIQRSAERYDQLNNDFQALLADNIKKTKFLQTFTVVSPQADTKQI